MPTQTQWIHILGMIVAAGVVIAGIYNQMQLASGLGVVVALINGVGLYLGGSPPAAGGP